MSSIFGHIVSADMVEDDVMAHIQAWWLTIAREFELQRGLARDVLPDPKSYLIAEDVDREAADALPSIVVVSPGLTGRPRQEGDGTYRATFGLAVGLFVSANTRRNTERLVRQYAAIVRKIMLTRAGEYADAVNWLDESYDDDFPFVDRQTISAGQVIFEVEVANVVNRYGGPVAPTPPDPEVQPGSNWPTANIVTATVKTKE
jgi:hypothetical protein